MYEDLKEDFTCLLVLYLPTRVESVAFGKRLSSSKRASMPIGFYNKEKKGLLFRKKNEKKE